MYKKLLIYFALLLLLPGNIYLAYRYWHSLQTGYTVEGEPNDFLCRYFSGNAVFLTIRNDNIKSAAASGTDSDFFWGTTDGFNILCYNSVTAFDYNKDYIFDLILLPGEKKAISVNGRYVPVLNKISDARTVTLPDGKTMTWKNNHWQ